MMKRTIAVFVTFIMLVASQCFGVTYYPNYVVANQAASSTGSTKAVIDAIGATKDAKVVFRHNSNGNNTTYTFNSDVTVPTNVKIEVEDGAIFAGTGQLKGITGDIKASWFGNLVIDGTTDNAAIVQKAVNAGNTTYGAWVYVPQGAAFTLKQASHVIVSTKIYECAESHTAGDWATDLAAGKWTDTGFVSSSGGIGWVTGTAYSIANASGVTLASNVGIIDDSAGYKRVTILNGDKSNAAWSEWIVSGGYHPAVVIDVHDNYPLGTLNGTTQAYGQRGSLVWRSNGSASWSIAQDKPNTGGRTLSVYDDSNNEFNVLWHPNGRTRYGSPRTVNTGAFDYTTPTYKHEFVGSLSIEGDKASPAYLPADAYLVLNIPADTVTPVGARKKTIKLEKDDGNLQILNVNGDVIFTLSDQGEINVTSNSAKNSMTLGATGNLKLVPGTTGGMNYGAAEAYVTLTGASTDIEVNVPSNARLLGAQLRVDTAVTSGDGATSWGAAFKGGSTTSLGTGKAFTKNTKVSTMLADSITSTETDITITPNSGTFSGGVIRAIVYYEYFTAMADAP